MVAGSPLFDAIHGPRLDAVVEAAGGEHVIELVLSSLRGPGEWREGTSPSRSLRTVRDSLPSYGSHSPAWG